MPRHIIYGFSHLSFDRAAPLARMPVELHKPLHTADATIQPFVCLCLPRALNAASKLRSGDRG